MSVRRLPLLAFLCALLALAPALDAPAASPREILIGASLSADGKYSAEGAHVRKGYDLAVDMVNRKQRLVIGDTLYTLRIKYYNDGSDPKRAAANAERLISEDHVRFMLGPYSSGLTRAVQKVSEKHRVPLVQGNGSARSLRSERHRFHFGIQTPADKDLAGVVDLFHAKADIGGLIPLSAALIFEKDAYSQDVRLGAVERLTHHGISIVLDDSFPDTLDDISDSLKRVKALRPDLLLISGHALGAATAVRQMEEIGIDAPMVAITQCDAAHIEEVSPRGAEHVVCPRQWHVDLPYHDDDLLFGTGATFVRLFRARYKHDPPYQSAQAAAAVQVLANAIVRAGSVDPDAVRDALARTDFMSFYGRVRFDRTGSNVAKDSVITQMVGGKAVLIAPADDAVERLVYPRMESDGQ